MRALEYPLTMSLEEFEGWAPTVAERWEWVRGCAIPVPHAFAGGTWAHARIASRIFAKLSAGLQPPCEAIIGDLMRVATPTSQRYGDIYVVCKDVDSGVTVLTAPKIVIEVVSHDSVERDLMEKRDEYLGIAGLEAYVAFFEEERRVLEYVPSEQKNPVNIVKRSSLTGSRLRSANSSRASNHDRSSRFARATPLRVRPSRWLAPCGRAARSGA